MFGVRHAGVTITSDNNATLNNNNWYDSDQCGGNMDFYYRWVVKRHLSAFQPSELA